jgi:hypothetical protein
MSTRHHMPSRSPTAARRGRYRRPAARPCATSLPHPLASRTRRRRHTTTLTTPPPSRSVRRGARRARRQPTALHENARAPRTSRRRSLLTAERAVRSASASSPPSTHYAAYPTAYPTRASTVPSPTLLLHRLPPLQHRGAPLAVSRPARESRATSARRERAERTLPCPSRGVRWACSVPCYARLGTRRRRGSERAGRREGPRGRYSKRVRAPHLFYALGWHGSWLAGMAGGGVAASAAAR